MTDCRCDRLPGAFFLDEAPPGWLESLREEATAGWKTLRRCPTCSRAFAVDAWDQGHDQVVVHVADSASWQAEADSVERRKALLLRSRGGLATGACAWADCPSSPVRGVAYCLDHLWESGARR